MTEKMSVPNFDPSELIIGRTLGSGEFCDVCEVMSICLARGGGGGPPGAGAAVDGREEDEEAPPSRSSVADRCLRGDGPYVVKRLRLELPEEERARGESDLASEARALSLIRHPNIVRLRGQSSEDTPRWDKFLLLDRLGETLNQRMGSWAARQKKASGCLGCFGVDRDAQRSLLEDRLAVMREVASVFEYLHSSDWIYRDIKLGNIGFDDADVVKVFDFGLCRRLPGRNFQSDGGLYRMTGRTGSLRYMAPEVALCRPYNLSADAFSFAVLLWQVMALRTPFEYSDEEDHIEKVSQGGYRPTVNKSWPLGIRKLIQSCWSEQVESRLDFSRIVSVLEEEMVQTQTECDSDSSVNDDDDDDDDEGLNAPLRQVV